MGKALRLARVARHFTKIEGKSVTVSEVARALRSQDSVRDLQRYYSGRKMLMLAFGNGDVLPCEVTKLPDGKARGCNDLNRRKAKAMHGPAFNPNA
jgi:hypothetical protein